jgi:hypothetical protein
VNATPDHRIQPPPQGYIALTERRQRRSRTVYE